MFEDSFAGQVAIVEIDHRLLLHPQRPLRRALRQASDHGSQSSMTVVPPRIMEANNGGVNLRGSRS